MNVLKQDATFIKTLDVRLKHRCTKKFLEQCINNVLVLLLKKKQINKGPFYNFERTLPKFGGCFLLVESHLHFQNR